MTIKEYIEQYTNPSDTDDALCEVTLGDLRRWEQVHRNMHHALLDAHVAGSSGNVALTQSILQSWNELWISVDQAMPKSGKTVVVSQVNSYGKQQVISAFYYPAMTWEAHPWDSDWVTEDWCDYDEENDLYYYPEGWYEFGYEMDTYHHISATVTHWMPLPEPPEVKTS